MLTKVPFFAGLGVAVAGTAYYLSNSHLVVPNDSRCYLQNIATGNLDKKIFTPGSYWLKPWIYPVIVSLQEEEHQLKLTAKSSDKQVIPIKVNIHSSFLEDSVLDLAEKYDIFKFHEKSSNEIGMIVTQELLRQYTLIQWIDNKKDIESQITGRIRHELNKKKIFCEKVQIEYDVNYIENLFLHFYPRDKLEEFPFYRKLQLM